MSRDMVLAVIPRLVLVSALRRKVRKMRWDWRSKKGTGMEEKLEKTS